MRLKIVLLVATVLLSGCVATTVVGTAVDVTTSVVETGVDVTTGVVSGAVDLVTGDDEDDDAD
ncbi:MAG: hypothetical protein AAFP68_12340 [Pseudomonadota bacterium]